jgi:hypothetical protein
MNKSSITFLNDPLFLFLHFYQNLESFMSNLRLVVPYLNRTKTEQRVVNNTILFISLNMLCWICQAKQVLIGSIKTSRCHISLQARKLYYVMFGFYFIACFQRKFCPQMNISYIFHLLLVSLFLWNRSMCDRHRSRCDYF